MSIDNFPRQSRFACSSCSGQPGLGASFVQLIRQVERCEYLGPEDIRVHASGEQVLAEFCSASCAERLRKQVLAAHGLALRGPTVDPILGPVAVCASCLGLLDCTRHHVALVEVHEGATGHECVEGLAALCGACAPVERQYAAVEEALAQPSESSDAFAASRWE